MNRIFQFSVSLASVALLILSSGLTAYGQTVDSPKTIKAISVEYVGEKGVSEDVILSNMSIKVGDQFSQAAVEDDIKSLFASGIVENIRILTEPSGANGVKVIVVVETRSLVSKVRFDGNTVYGDDKLYDKVALKPGEPLTEAQVQAGQKAIVKVYRDGGYADATVAYEIKSTGKGGFAEVLYKIDEGGKSMLNEVQFVGNTAFSSKVLRAQMKSKEQSLLAGWLGSGKINNDQLEDDLDAVEKYYRDRGYLNAKVTDARRIRKGSKSVDLVVTIEEGEKYTVDAVQISGATRYNTGDLTPMLKSAPGQVFSAENVESDLKNLRDYYGERGYTEARVIPNLDGGAGNTVSIDYEIEEGERNYIRNINITGNDKTQDDVIRRELAVVPGEVASTTRIAASQRRVQNMNYFTTVDFLPVDTGVEGWKDLEVHVTEKPTGTFNFGAGFSSIDNLVGFIEVTQTNFDIGNWPNFTGAGQRFRAAARVGTERMDFVASLTEPWFLGRPLALGGEVFYRDYSFLSDDYNQTNYGLQTNLRKKIGEYASLQGLYTLQNVEINDISASASPTIMSEAGTYLQSMIGVDLVHDTRDDLFLPRTGHRINLGTSYSGLGGDVEDHHVEAGAIQHLNLPFDTILSIEGHVHVVSGDDVPIFERQFLGGANNLRGFDYRDVGPRDENGEAIGGKTSAYATIEYTIPVIRQLRTAFFYDIGMVSADDYDFGGGVSSNVGFGLRLFLPIGPLRLDYGIPVSSDEFNDSDGRFNFNIGYRF